MRHFTLLILLAFLFSACVRNNPKPVWLKISAWSLQENPDPSAEDPGDLTSNFTNAWVYVDNKLIGVFEVPCTIPVLMSGNKNVRIYPTVINNGISATKKIYPFCEPYSIDLDLVEGETYAITPTTHYKTECHFWVEDFEDPSIKLDPDGNSTATLVRENVPALSLTGYYGHVALTTSDSLWVATTSGEMHLPGGGAEVYLEIDYRNDNKFETGVMSVSSSTGVSSNASGGFNPQNTATMVWKKMYIDMREIVSYYTSADYFKQYIVMLIQSGKTNADIYIDNIRVIYM